MIRRLAQGAALLAALGFVVWLAARAGVGDVSRSFVDRIPEARLDPGQGEFAVFTDSEDLTGVVTLSDAGMDALTPPFPSDLAFDVRVPPASTLVLSSALVMMQQVSRARVTMAVEIDDGGGGGAATVWSATYGLEEANRWHGSRVDLSAYGGRDVTLTFSARPAGERDDVLWGNRVRVAWGRPRLTSETSETSETSATSATSATDASLRDLLERATELGAPGGSTGPLVHFLNLVLAAIASLVPPGRLRLGASPGVAILFTLAATLMVAAVQSSVPLALGLLGALSILRFRAPVPKGTDLLHLVYCLSVALAFGTNQRPLGLVAAVTYFVVSLLARYASRHEARHGVDYRFVAEGPNDPEIASRFRALVGSGRETSIHQSPEKLGFDARMSMAGLRDIAAFMFRARQEAPRFRLTFRRPSSGADGY